MGKVKNFCCVVDNEVMVKLCMFCIFLQKLNLVVGMICGKKVEKVLIDLIFFNKCVVVDVKKCFQFVIVNVENNYNLDVDELIVVEVYVGKNLIMKCGCFWVCGCFGKIIKLFVEIIIKVC